jgi:hypothetical protein
MPEPSRDKDITPIDLRDVHRSTQLGQIPITQLERREPNALETNGINRQPEREVGSALRHQEVSRDLFCIAGEKSVEPPLGSGAQRDVLHMVGGPAAAAHDRTGRGELQSLVWTGGSG